jgi:D-beta-D-heptose 7-phosphate kinase/D-beta-D-heptose 1-phosphate adenosyltransferase
LLVNRIKPIIDKDDEQIDVLIKNFLLLCLIIDISKKEKWFKIVFELILKIYQNIDDEKETSLVKVNNKVIYDSEVDKLTEFQNKNVVFTNGCFDIIHSAHLKLLNFSKQQGDVLVVGLNSDDSIKRIKGETRPINDINERSELLLNLNNIVDYVVIFNEDTPYNILKYIQPNVIVKGGDYKKEDIIGGEFANEILLFDYINGKSTSLVIHKINSQT